MKRKRIMVIAAIVLSTALVLIVSGQAIAQTEKKPVLIIGALYGGPITDAGYNQAMHTGVIAIEKNIKGVKIIEAENVADEAGATLTMENMIQQGAKLIIATAFNHQNPAFKLSKKISGCYIRACRRLENGP